MYIYILFNIITIIEKIIMQSPNEYFTKSIKPILQPLFLSILSKKPPDVISYSINWLRRKGNYTTEGLTIEEKDELNYLRKINSNTNNKSDNDDSSSDSSDQETSSINNDTFQLSKPKPRNGVCGDIINNKQINHDHFLFYSLTSKAIFIKTSLLNSFLFSSLDADELNVIVNSMEEETFYKNDIVIQQGDEGNCLYLVQHGQLNCFKCINNSNTNTNVLVKTYFRGEIFGELSILYNSPRAATVIAASDSVRLLKLNRDTFSFIVKESAKQKLRKYEAFLKKVEIFSTMGQYEILKICDALFEMDFNRGDFVITEGELDDYFYIVVEGTAHAIKQIDDGVTMIVKEYERADYFGELALIKNAPRAVSIIATSVS
jgi:cAMP-dependent protein kinase regulator